MAKKKSPFDIVRNPTADEILDGMLLAEKFDEEKELSVEILSDLFNQKFVWEGKDTMSKKQQDIFLLKVMIIISKISSSKVKGEISNGKK